MNASLAIQVHTAAAISAFGIGVVQIAGRKGSISHRTLGWLWVGLMVIVAATGFFIHEIRMFGPWSPIHLLSIAVLIQLPIAVIAARRHNIRVHRSFMLGMFAGALVVAGLFTFLPGRILGRVVFG